MIHHVLRDAEAVYDSWTNWFFSMNLFNRFANRNKRLIHELQWSDCSCSRVENSLIQMIRLERVFFSELNSQVKNREISWARATDAVKSKLLMSKFMELILWQNNLNLNCVNLNYWQVLFNKTEYYMGFKIVLNLILILNLIFFYLNIEHLKFNTIVFF